MKPSDIVITGLEDFEGMNVQHVLLTHSTVVVGANFVKDFFAKVTDVVGGRNTSYEKAFDEATKQAIKNMQEQAIKAGANAIVRAGFEYNSMGKNGSILSVHAYGTAVKISDKPQ